MVDCQSPTWKYQIRILLLALFISFPSEAFFVCFVSILSWTISMAVCLRFPQAPHTFCLFGVASVGRVSVVWQILGSLAECVLGFLRYSAAVIDEVSETHLVKVCSKFTVYCLKMSTICWFLPSLLMLSYYGLKPSFCFFHFTFITWFRSVCHFQDLKLIWLIQPCKLVSLLISSDTRVDLRNIFSEDGKLDKEIKIRYHMAPYSTFISSCHCSDTQVSTRKPKDSWLAAYSYQFLATNIRPRH